METDGDAETGTELQPDRYNLLSVAGSFFFEPAGGREGFESPPTQAAARRPMFVSIACSLICLRAPRGTF